MNQLHFYVAGAAGSCAAHTRSTLCFMRCSPSPTGCRHWKVKIPRCNLRLYDAVGEKGVVSDMRVYWQSRSRVSRTTIRPRLLCRQRLHNPPGDHSPLHNIFFDTLLHRRRWPPASRRCLPRQCATRLTTMRPSNDSKTFDSCSLTRSTW